jgi:hypothetical protein
MLKKLMLNIITVWKMKNTNPLGAQAKLITAKAINMLDMLIIGRVPNLPTRRFATNSGKSEPIPAKPIISPQTANETPICSMISGILGMKVMATKPWVKKKTASAL